MPVSTKCVFYDRTQQHFKISLWYFLGETLTEILLPIYFNFTSSEVSKLTKKRLYFNSLSKSLKQAGELKYSVFVYIKI